MALKVLDLFSGTGGFSLGLQQAGGYDTVALCEIEKHPRIVLQKHWPDVPIIEDIKDFPFKTLKGEIDVMTGGFPCQDISIANTDAKGLAGERSGLWHNFRDAIDDVRPRFAIVENVFALQSRGLDIILGQMASIGYDTTWAMFDSQYFGVPQRRRRIYIVAVRDGIPAGTEVFENRRRSGPDAARKIIDFKESRTRHIQQRSEGGEGLAYFTRQRSDQFAELGVASTILKRDYKDFTDLIVHPDGAVRKLVPRERLRLQGYPDTYFDDLDIPRTELYRMNGMTIPVIKYIGERINATLV